MNARHQQFINEYLTCWNATEAYRRVYPSSSEESARRSGQRLLTNVDISLAVQQRINEKAMTADEVLLRLADHARGDLGEFLVQKDDDTISVDLDGMKKAGKTHLIKRITQTKRRRSFKDVVEEEISVSLELYDAQAANVQVGKHHKLFVDRNEVKIDDTLDDTARAARIAAILELARERRDRPATEDEFGDVEAVAGATD
jgi:phage terminase small subunit